LVKSVFAQLQNEIEQKLFPPAAGSDRDTSHLSLFPPFNTPYKLDKELKSWINVVAKNALLELPSIRTRFNETIQTLNSSISGVKENPRGLINFCGEALKWLFGTVMQYLEDQNQQQINRLGNF
jgi:hypothetical protein